MNHGRRNRNVLMKRLDKEKLEITKNKKEEEQT
jgi:hypothetical protein